MSEEPKTGHERVQAWNENGAICIIAVSPHGDPVDMSPDEARAFVEEINKCIEEVEK